MSSKDDPVPVPATPGEIRDPARDVQTSPPPTVVIHQHGGGILWRLLAFLGWAGFGLVALLAFAQFAAFKNYFDTSQGISEKFHSGKMFASDKVAIVSIEGLIADGDGFVKAQIDQIRDDQDVKAVVVRVDSPGGTVTASDYMLHHLKKLREERNLPLVVSMGGIAASGGYYVSMAVGDQDRSIFAEPTTTTGSIGVMFPHYDVSGLLARFDVKDDSLVTHPRKQMASMTTPMTDEHRQLLQSYINESFERFKDIVKQGRPRFRDDTASLDEIATGETFSANQALRHGLIDAIGFLEDAIDRAAALAGLDKQNMRVIRFERPASLFQLAGVAHAPMGPRDSVEWPTLLELSTPRAYYLATMWPPLLSTSTWLSPAYSSEK